MKSVFMTILLLLAILQAGAQEIQVESFKLLQNDLDAKVHHPKNDQNGKKAAIIKVVTPEKGFSFDVGSLGVVATEQQDGEIWVYVPSGIQKITIKHPTLGLLRDYYFDRRIDRATVYELKITTAKVRTIVEEDAGGQYWVLSVFPKDAEVTIGGGSPELLQEGVLQKLLQYGRHTYTVKAPLYESTGGEISIGHEKVATDVKLTPAFGYLRISTVPAEATDIYINGNKIGKAPILTGRLPNGNVTVRAVSPMFEPLEQLVTVPTGGDTLICPIVLSANFAEVEIAAAAQDVAIYVNDENRATGNWKGRLIEGLYKVEGRKPGYRTAFRSVNVRKGKPQTIHLEALTPIYGKIDVNVGSLANVTVAIDGKKWGAAPNIFSDVLVGKHTLQLSKDGYKPYQEEIVVEEGRLHKIQAELEKELWGHLLITTSSSEATIIVDDDRCLNTFDKKVKAGEHLVKIAYDSYEKTEVITVIPGKKNEFNYPLEGKLLITSSPSRASVFINSSYIGTTPVSADVFGTKEILISKGDKYYRHSEKVYVPPTETVRKHYKLTKRPKDLYSFWMYDASLSAPYGGMFGMCRVFGWYGKCQVGEKADVDWNLQLSDVKYETIEKGTRHRMSVTTGPMVRLAKWLYLYAGAGYGDYGRIYSADHSSFTYTSYRISFCPLRCKGLEAEAGAIFKWKALLLSGGYSTIFSSVPAGEKRFGDVHIGIGFTINHSK